MNTITVHADSKITKVLITLFKAFSVSFEVKKDTQKEDKPYGPEFVKMVLEASKSKVRIPYDEEFKKKLFQDL